ncbi:MAG: MATE family efflux transporter, partial [Clostridia bacterium]
YGAKNKEKIHEALRLSVYAAVVIGIVSFLVIQFAGNSIVDLFLTNPEGRNYGYRYLDYIKWCTIITAVTIAFSNAFRSIEKTMLPLISAAAGIVVNIFFNYCLIFGHFGFPELDSAGAAIATVLSRVVELIIILSIALIPKKSYFKSAFAKLKVSIDLLKQYFKKGVPLVFNELMWSVAVVLFALFYTWKNDMWYNAFAYSQNITDLFFIMFAGLGNGTAIIVGSSLGAGKFEEAKANADRMKGLGIMLGLGLGVLMAITSPFIADMFHPDAATKAITIEIINITSIFLAIYAYNSVCFFILRSGGDSLRAFILDQMPTYLISLPIAIVLGINAKNWGLTLATVFAIAHICDIVKLFLSTYFVKKNKWIVNLTVKKNQFPN